jgi:hypothetical protein
VDHDARLTNSDLAKSLLQVASHVAWLKSPEETLGLTVVLKEGGDYR